MSAVDPGAVQQLRQFRHDNSHGLAPRPEPDVEATDDEVRDLLAFAARYWPRTPEQLRSPVHLEAVRVIRLVPEDVGAALFETTP